MKGSAFRFALALALVAGPSPLAFAQGGAATSTLTGVVQDASGGVIPGAAVVVKNDGTRVTFNTVTNSHGSFSVPSLAIGSYTVTVSLPNFKTTVVRDVKLAAGALASIKVTLEIGGITDTTIIVAQTELVQTQSANVSTTINADQINSLPLATRNALNFVTLLPGVDTSTSNRASTVMGLPQSALSITMDGVSIQDNYLKTGDGFFARVTPRQDAIEEVTVSSATPGANAAGQGAVQIQFVTRSGTNQFKGTLYQYHRDSNLNTNYWFNIKNGLPKNQVTLNQIGGSEGGPIVIPGLFDGRAKAFFFVNYEELRQPTNITRTRTILQPSAQSGVFSYNVTSGGVTTVRTVDLLALAASNGQTATPDATVSALLAEIRAATATAGVVAPNGADPMTSLYLVQNSSYRIDRQPTVRVDYNLGPSERLSGTYTVLKLNSDPDILNSGDTAFPGLPNHRSQLSYRYSSQATLRSTITSRMVNELRYGGAWGPTYFGPEVTPSQFANQGGFNLTLPLVSSATVTNAPSSRQAANWNVDETLTWLKGKHNFSFGGNFTRVNLWLKNQTMVPTITFGVDSTDPANAMFTTANFSGAASADLNNARNVYAMLTGRVTGISGNVRLDENTNQYAYLGSAVQRGRLDEVGIFAQDAWRLTPTFTVNAGLRWEVQRPFEPLNDIFATATMADICGVSGQGTGPAGRGCNLFKPGTLSGTSPQFVAYNSGQPGYRTDYNNVAPNVGMAWRPNAKAGLFRTLFGDPDQATIRVGYSVAYNRNGMSDFTDVYGANPGSTVTVNRNTTLGDIFTAGPAPLLLRTPALLGPPPVCAGGQVAPVCTPTAPSYPLAATNQSVNIFDPNLQVSFSRSYTVGLQRSVGRDMAVDVRYVGTRNVNGWTTENWNEQNVFESGFLDEFRVAQANLFSNIANGKGNTFAYMGPGTGTGPLPIYLAAFTGTPLDQAGDVTKYTSAAAISAFTNTTFLGRLSIVNPNATGALNDLWGNAGRRGNLQTASITPNLIVLNPDLGASSANVTRSASYTKYDSLQVELRRRFAHGLNASANYTYSTRWGSTFDSVRFDRYLARSTAAVPNAFKVTWAYEIPVGRGRRFGTNMNRWMDGAFGGWEWDGTGRVQSGRVLTLSGVRLVGMNAQELQRAFRIRIAADKTVTTLPDDIILNTRRAFSTDPTTASGYGALGAPTGRYIAPASTLGCIEIYPGDCGEPKNIYVSGPLFTRFDMSVKKTFPLGGRRTAQVEFDLLNAFNAINFNPVFQAGTSATLNQVTSAYQDTSNTFDPGGRLGQIVWRINW